MRQYLFFTEFPLMERGFYFYAENAVMKKSTMAYEEVDESDILSVKVNNQGKTEIKKCNKSSAQLILQEIKKNQVYKEYKGKEENLYYHYHNLFEISMIVSGEGYYFAEGRAIKVQAGSIVVFNSLVPHAWIANEANRPVLKTFTFYQHVFLEDELVREEGKLIKEYLEKFTVLDLHEEEAKKGVNILEMLYEEYKNKNINYKVAIKHLLLVFLIEIIRLDKKKVENIHKRSANIELERAIKYIKNNFYRNVTLEEVAKEVYMHPNYFSAVFKKKYGTSFVEYMNSLKISMAIELMEGTDLSIQEIASRCGFTSLSNFYRVFKGIHEISPTKYIKQM